MPNKTKDNSQDDARPVEEITDSDEERTRPMRRRRPTVAPPPAPAAIRPQRPPTSPVQAAKRKRKPTIAPPPAPSGIMPQAPPSAPVSTRRQRRPTMAPPPASSGIRPQAPPTSPFSASRPRLFDDDDELDNDVSEVDPLADLSEPARALMLDVASCVPIDSSFDLSQKITDHLASFWRARRDHLITDDDGKLEKDYEGSLRIAKSIIVGSLSGGLENLVEEAKSISDELDPTAIGYYARNLPPNELRVVQSFHDLAVALMFYKVSFHVEDPADRQVMLASSMGAQGSLQSALDWFAGLPVPEVISNYAGLLEFKIDAEARRSRL